MAVRLLTSKPKLHSDEETLQTALNKLLDDLLCHTDSFRHCHVPNGGMRKKSVACKLKAQGVKSGVSDHLIFLPGGRSFQLELKSMTGRQEPTQKEWQANMERLGHDYHIIQAQNPWELQQKTIHILKQYSIPVPASFEVMV